MANRNKILYITDYSIHLEIGTHLLTLRKEVVVIEDIFQKEIDTGEYEERLEMVWKMKVRFLSNGQSMEFGELGFMLDRCVIYKYKIPYWIAKFKKWNKLRKGLREINRLNKQF